MGLFRIMLFSPSMWRDILCLAASVSMLEAALTGWGTTHGRGARHQWKVVPWLRPILAVGGFVFLAFALLDFFRTI